MSQNFDKEQLNNYTDTVHNNFAKRRQKKLKNWSKTLLYSYRYLETIVDTIDDMVKKISLYSMYYNGKTNTDTLSQINKLIELNDRKVNLINLKVLIEETLDMLSCKDLQFVSLYYIDGLKSEETAKVMGVSLRTFFRRRNRAIEKFTDILAAKYSAQYFFDNYIEETWLIDLYKYYSRKEMEDNSYIEDSLDIANKKLNNGKYIFDTIKQLRKITV